MVRPRKPPSPTWRAFLKNHIKDIVAVDFFVVPTIRNQALFVFLLLARDRRRLLHFNDTANPTARWTAQQMVEAFPWMDPPKYVLRDRDSIYGGVDGVLSSSCGAVSSKRRRHSGLKRCRSRPSES